MAIPVRFGMTVSPIYGNDLDTAWRKAIASIGVNDPKLTVSFFKSELSQVIVPQQVRNAADYMRVLRKGRGTRLNRAQKLVVWKVVETYRRIMQANDAYDVDTAMQNVVSLLTQGDAPRKYAHVVVDEGQDFSAPAYRVIRALVDEGDNDIFIVGDAQQRIYGHTRGAVEMRHPYPGTCPQTADQLSHHRTDS